MLRILIHDVGHGHSVHIFTPNGKNMVIDLGSSDIFSPLEWLRKDTDVIHSLVITHPHGDHIDEILKINNLDFKVEQFSRPKWLTEESIRKANQSNYSEKLDCYFSTSQYFSGVVPESMRVGNPAVTGGVSITHYASSTCGQSNINNHSMVTIIEYQGVKVVIPGDNEPPSWNSLLEESDFLSIIENTDIFMSSHHGRKSGYSSDLLSIMKPKLCIVSDGRVQDTDATSRYSYHATGWTVHSKSKGSGIRKCLTTRSDGFVDIKIGINSNDKSYLAVNTA